MVKKIVLFIGLFILAICFFQHQFYDLSIQVSMGAVALTMALFWIFEVLPLGITAMIPIVAYPCLGILSTKKIAPIYMSSVLLLFIGGFFVALGMQRWNLHKRLALTIISKFGSSPAKLLLGFMVATSFLSMWISNTASTVMMVAIGMAIATHYEESYGLTGATRNFSKSIMLGIAYSATIGGMATLIGTPPNLAFTRIYALSFPGVEEISFGAWFSFGLPISLLLLGISWLVISYKYIFKHDIAALDEDVIKDEIRKLGPIKYEEKWVAFSFAFMALMWISRKDLNLGFLSIPGWSNLFKSGNLIDDGTVAVFAALLLFGIRTKSKDYPYKRILDESTIKQIPWQTILLFGGGFALAKGIQSSGLSETIGAQFANLKDVPIPVIVATITGGITFLTELTSNMASTEMILPILAAVAKSSGVEPLLMMIPATLAASCAFMLPAATAPNAIVFGSGKIRMKDMVSTGFKINLIAIVVVSIVSLYFIPLIIS